MRGLIFASLLVLSLATFAWPSPFVISAPYTAPAVIPDYFKVVLDATPAVNSPAYQVPATSNYILHFDVGGVTVGSHTLSVQACKAATLWGPEACSAAVNFPFVRPATTVAPAGPSGIGLSAQ